MLMRICSIVLAVETPTMEASVQHLIYHPADLCVFGDVHMHTLHNLRIEQEWQYRRSGQHTFRSVLPQSDIVSELTVLSSVRRIPGRNRPQLPHTLFVALVGFVW